MDRALLVELKNYKIPPGAVDLIRNTRITFLVGIAAAGKDTVARHLLKSPDYHEIVSHTTRPPRRNHGVLERNGVDYHFIDLKTVKTMLSSGDFIEAKLNHDNVYGTSVAEIKKAHDEGKIALTDLDVQGVAEYRAVAENVIAIFLLPPNFDTWQKRLSKRYGQDGEKSDLDKRFETAKSELKEALSKNYFEYVINDDIDKTVKAVDQIAHGNFSMKKNAAAKQIAEELLDKLNQI